MEKSLDSQLWHACAGGMVQMPLVSSRVFYFPQGHAEHALASTDFGLSLRVPGLIPCVVSSIRFLADPETDEVYAKLGLIPVPENEIGYQSDREIENGEIDNGEKPASFAKTLTQSDANNGGGFSVPRYCAETIFPRLDYNADPPVQTVIAKDVHGEVWKFRHIYRGTPRRHLLTTGWSSFVNQKKLIAGDSIVFLRGENGDLYVGIRRAKRGIPGPESSPICGNWNPSSGNNCGFSMFLSDNDNNSSNNKVMMMMNLRNNGFGRKMRPESVIEAASLAASGQPFEVMYYPRASTPEFCVKASNVKAAMRIQWCSGMRFKMPFETEDSSRISWFMGTVGSVQVADPVRWPNSPWRLLQVTWDEPDLLQNVKRVSPWLVELVSNMPVIHLSPFSPPRKKLRGIQNTDFPFDGQYPLSPSSFTTGNPLGPCNNTIVAGIQGARHAQFGISLSDLHINNNNNHHNRFQKFGFDPYSRLSNNHVQNNNENISCLLTMGISNQNSEKRKSDDSIKKPQFLLFGQPILTEQQIFQSCSSEDNYEKGKVWSNGSGSSSLDMKTSHWCMVYIDSEDVGRTLDLSVLESYEEMYKNIPRVFGLEKLERVSHVIYRDATGALKHAGDEPFSHFKKTAKRVTVLTGAGSGNVGRKWITGLGNAENGIDSSTTTGPLSIFV